MDIQVNCCSKYFLFTFNTLFWIVSLLFIAIASWAWHTKGFFDNIDEVTGIPVDPVMVIMIVGCIIFILSFAGCIGALRENITLLKFFSSVLGVIFFGQVIIGILAFIYKDWFRDRVNEFIDTTIDRYVSKKKLRFNSDCWLRGKSHSRPPFRRRICRRGLHFLSSCDSDPICIMP